LCILFLQATLPQLKQQHNPTSVCYSRAEPHNEKRKIDSQKEKYCKKTKIFDFLYQKIDIGFAHEKFITHTTELILFFPHYPLIVSKQFQLEEEVGRRRCVRYLDSTPFHSYINTEPLNTS